VIGHTMHFKKIQKVTCLGQRSMCGNPEELTFIITLKPKAINA